MKKTISWSTLQQRIADGVIRHTETLRVKGKLYAQVVLRDGTPKTVRIEIKDKS